MKLVITSLYANPPHAGHIEYLNLARELADTHVTIVNNDNQAVLKHGKTFIPESDRLSIIGNLKSVDVAIMSIDEDSTVCKSLSKLVEIAKTYGFNEFIFAKGGDRNQGNIPEATICEELGVKIVDGLGSKIQSSSIILENYVKN